METMVFTERFLKDYYFDPNTQAPINVIDCCIINLTNV